TQRDPPIRCRANIPGLLEAILHLYRCVVRRPKWRADAEGRQRELQGHLILLAHDDRSGEATAGYTRRDGRNHLCPA
ncbi:hypothetical protein AAVH_43695, partial [Aphelenchoides avenae]